MGYYSVLKVMGILTCVIAWMNPEDIGLSEISWTQKDKYY